MINYFMLILMFVAFFANSLVCYHAWDDFGIGDHFPGFLLIVVSALITFFIAFVSARFGGAWWI